MKAESSLETSKLAKSKDWKVSAAYYTMYFSVYSLLQKIGVKCEIHTCTIHFAKEFLKDYFSKEQFELLDDAFEARQDMQYYVDREVDDTMYNNIMKKSAGFMIHCKESSLRITQKNVRDIRAALEKMGAK